MQVVSLSVCWDSFCAISSLPSPVSTRSHPTNLCKVSRRSRVAGKAPCRVYRRLKKHKKKSGLIEGGRERLLAKLTILVIVWIICHATQFHQFWEKFLAELAHQLQLINHLVFNLLKLRNGSVLIVKFDTHVVLAEGLVIEDN